MRELVGQPRLAHARLSHHGDELAVAGRGEVERAAKLGQLGVAADEPAEPARRRRIQSRAARRDPGELVHVDRHRQPAHGNGPERLQRHVPLGEARGLRGEQDRPG